MRAVRNIVSEYMIIGEVISGINNVMSNNGYKALGLAFLFKRAQPALSQISMS